MPGDAARPMAVLIELLAVICVLAFSLIRSLS
jgi:hypothetical protein